MPRKATVSLDDARDIKKGVVAAEFEDNFNQLKN